MATAGQTFVEKVEHAFSVHYPKTFKSIQFIDYDMIDDIGMYSYLYGKVQSGKSRAIGMMIWLYLFKYQLCPIFITKKLNSIRIDIIDKLTNQSSDLIKIIHNCGIEYGLSSQEIKKYIPNMSEYENTKHMSTIEQGCVPVFLMQKDNFDQLSRYQHMIVESNRKSVFIIDEVHELYSEQGEFIIKNGLKSTQTHSNIGLLHWMKKQVEQNLSHMVGVTATPYRIFADPFIRPTGSLDDNGGVHRLEADQPFTDAKYVGYNDDNSYTFNINTYADENITYVIDQVYARPRTNEVPFILCTNERINENQDGLVENLLIHCRTNSIPAYIKSFHQKTSLSQHNCDTLDDFFRAIPGYIYESGIIIMIGDKRLDTGVTIKPSSSLNCVRGIMKIAGITDQINGTFKTLEANMQKCRLFGWYSADHQSNLWVPADEVEIYEQGIPQVHNQILDKYDGNIICEIKTPTSKMTHITGTDKTDMYKVIVTGNNKKCLVEIKCEKPENIPELKTKIYKMSGSGTIEEQRSGNGQLKTPYKTHINSVYNNVNPDKLQVAWSDARYKEIQKAIFEPADTDSKSNWQVNAFIYGPEYNNSAINECTFVTFDDDYETRIQKQLIIEHHNQLCCKIGDNMWLVATNINYAQQILHHKYINQINAGIESSERSEEHHKVIDKIDLLWKLIENGTKPVSGWLLFRKVRKELKLMGGGGSKTCAPEWANPKIKIEFNMICMDDMIDLNTKIIKGKEVYKKFFPTILPVSKIVFKKLVFKQPIQTQFRPHHPDIDDLANKLRLTLKSLTFIEQLNEIDLIVGANTLNLKSITNRIAELKTYI